MTVILQHKWLKLVGGVIIRLLLFSQCVRSSVRLAVNLVNMIETTPLGETLTISGFGRHVDCGDWMNSIDLGGQTSNINVIVKCSGGWDVIFCTTLVLK